MYSVPAREETYGDTERIIGTWFKKTGRREEVVLASKIWDLTLTLPICARRMTSPASI
jgi:aryl-alcohol dehydrogenase-like predicted oxidoreductase